MSSFPWEVNQENLYNFFEGPHLFSALYRVYRGAYYGQGFQLIGSPLKTSIPFQKGLTNYQLNLKELYYPRFGNLDKT
jgi:hypothetical protein